MTDEPEIKNPETIGPNRFTFNGNIIAEIGEESISNPFIAIAELIKNSYDADAKQVVLNFPDLRKHNARLEISDDGCGMDSAQIKDNWMDIGSPHKKEIEKTDEYGRIPVGAKGIGRFASHCLGQSLKLITNSKNEHFGYSLHFDWKKFSPKVKATDVDVATQRFKKKMSARGTKLIIEELKQHYWNDAEKLRELLRDVFLLTSPVNLPKNFRIKENISKQCSPLKKLDVTFLNKSAYHLNVKLSGRKEILYEFYKNNEKIRGERNVLNSDLACGNVEFDLYFYYKRPDKWKDYLGKVLSKSDIEEISDMLTEYGGLKLYRDKFRVKPYGDKDADWIGLDKWSRDNTMVPGNTQVIGIVSIGKETNPDIEDTTTREGVVNKPQFFDLIKFVTSSIKLFVDLRSEVESDKAKARKVRKKTKKQKIEVVAPKIEEESITSQDTLFIDVKGSFPTTHYAKLIFEANECETRNYPNAAFWISRKIIENLTFHVIEKKFPKSIDMWYDTTNTRNHQFSTLIRNLYESKSQFPIQLQDQIEQLNTDVGKFKKAVDAAVHRNYVYLSDKTELKQYQIPKIIQMLLDVYSRI